MQSFEKTIGLAAGVIIGGAQLIYLFNTVKRKITPSILSWFGWACLMGTSVVSQVISKGWQWSMTGIFCSTIGCSAIAVAGLASRNYSYKKSDLRFLALGLGCIALYSFSSDPWITTIFAIVADFILAVPTIRKAYKDPATERTISWILGVVSSTLALTICLHHDLIYVLFPAYLFLFNGGMVWLTRIA